MNTHKICNTVLTIFIMLFGLYVLHDDMISDWYVIWFAVLGFMSWSIVSASVKS